MIALMRQEMMVDYWQVARAQQGGGYFGGLMATALTTSVGNMGAIFILIVLGFVGALLVSGITREDMSHYLKSAISRPDEEAIDDAAPRPDIRMNPGRSQRAQAVQLKLVPPEDKPQSAASAAPKARQQAGPIRHTSGCTGPAREPRRWA